MSESKKILYDKEMALWAFENGCLNTLLFFEISVKTNNIDALEWGKSKNFPCNESIIYKAVEYGNLEAFKWLVTKKYKFEKNECSSIAGAYNQIHMLNFFLQEDENPTLNYKDTYLNNKSWNRVYFDRGVSATWEEAAEKGNIDVLRWVHENKISTLNQNTIYAASKTNQMDVIKYLVYLNPEILNTPFGKFVLNNIVRYNNTEDIQWLIDQYPSNLEMNLKYWK